MTYSPLQFLDKLNDGGLYFLNHYLEERCECNVFHISPSRRIIYDGSLQERCRELKKLVTAVPMNNEFLYDAENQYMVYQFSINEARQQLVFFPVTEEECGGILNTLNEIIMPLSFYLKGLYFSFFQYKGLLQNDPEQIFQPTRDYWNNLLAARMINPEAEVTAVILEPSELKENVQDVYRSITNLCLRDGGSDILSYIHHGRFVLLVPGRYHVLVRRSTSGSTRSDFPLYAHLKILEDQYGCCFSSGVGHRVKYADMYNSYVQALSSLFYLSFFRKEEHIIRFHAGLMPDPAGLTEHFSALEKYSSLHKYDNDRSGNLLSTLRELVRCQFNYQDAAQRLHIHLNTLYYRQEKLAFLLGMDLGGLESKIILYQDVFALDFSAFLQDEIRVI